MILVCQGLDDIREVACCQDIEAAMAAIRLLELGVDPLYHPLWLTIEPPYSRWDEKFAEGVADWHMEQHAKDGSGARAFVPDYFLKLNDDVEDEGENPYD